MAVVALTEIEELSGRIVDDLGTELTAHVKQLRLLLGGDGTAEGDGDLQRILSDHADRLRSLLDGGDVSDQASLSSVLAGTIDALDQAIAERLADAETKAAARFEALTTAADERLTKLDGALGRHLDGLNRGAGERVDQLDRAAEHFVDRIESDVLVAGHRRSEAIADALARRLVRVGLLLIYLAGVAALVLSLGGAGDNDGLRTGFLALFILVTAPLLFHDPTVDRIVGNNRSRSVEQGPDQGNG